MVVPNRHVASLVETTPEELAEMMAFARDAEMALSEAYQPQGINVGINLGRPAGAGIIDHIHIHLVPRWTGDTNFMSVVGGTRVLPEDMRETVARLKPIFERLKGRRETATARQRRITTEHAEHEHEKPLKDLRSRELCSSVSMVLELSAEHLAFKQSIEQFAREVVAPRAAAIDESGEYPLDVMRAAAGRGLLGATLPSEWGGAGLDFLSYVLAIEAIASASATVAVSLVVQNSLVADLIAHAGRPDQKEQWLRRLASGDAIGAFALSEPDAGTDAANQKTQAVKTGDGYRISGRKVWVANADVASVAIVFARTRPGLRGKGITAFVVPMDTPGITRIARADSLGVRGLGCMDLELDVTVGDRQVLGSVDHGFRLAMWALEGGRIAIAAQALGIGEAAIARSARLREAARDLRSADRQLPGDPVDAGRHGHRARGGADADVEGGCRPRAPGTRRASKRRWRSWRPRRRRTRPPTGRCRSSPRPAIAAARSPNACSATCARRRSIRERPKRSG